MIFPYMVRVPDERDPRNGHDTIEWLKERGKNPGKHYDFHMHGGQSGYTSFWFKSRTIARWVALVWT
jgi:hypothetical protein